MRMRSEQQTDLQQKIKKPDALNQRASSTKFSAL